MKFFASIFKSAPKHSGKVAALGLSTAGLIAYNMLILPWEGNVLNPYLDVGGVPTACGGITGVEITQAYRAGRVFTVAECDALNIGATRKHDERVHRAVTYRPIPDFTMASFISFDFNTGRIFNSTLTNKANVGDLLGACNQLSRWVRVKGVVVRGLENRRFLGDGRRISERTLCLIGLNPEYKTPLFETLWHNYLDWSA